jgi:putative ABC transport system permease protein
MVPNPTAAVNAPGLGSPGCAPRGLVRYLIPVGGMVIGNAMSAAAVALNRLGQDVEDSRAQIEATLALGATATEAIRPLARRSLRSARSH